MAQLTLKNVYKKYDDGKGKKKKQQDQGYAVEDLCFSCSDGEFIGILGPSGCGKTTTLRMIAGLEEITGGGIYIDQEKINDVKPKDRNIGLAFEDYALYPPINVYENIAFNMRAKRIDEQTIKTRVEEIARLMEVTDLLDHRPGGLSGGQMQRVNIARAIVRKPKILLLDEPLSHLDGKMRQVLRTEIKRLHKEIQCTTILVTHDQLEAMSLADKIVIMKDGRLQQYGTPLEIYDNPANEFVANFIGEPPMNISDVDIIKKRKRLYFYFPHNDITFPVPDRYSTSVHEHDTVRIGVRPMDIILTTDAAEGTQVPVSVFENLGDEQRVSFHVAPDNLFTLIIESHRNYRPGEMIRVKFNEKKVHLFNRETGEKIMGIQ
jgi:multiple sugar transport system ATP-binding protein